MYDYETNTDYLPKTTYQPQALYLGCQRLLYKSTDFTNPKALDSFFTWEEKLEKEFQSANVLTYGYQILNPAGAEASLLKIDAYETLKDKDNYADSLLSSYQSYGTMECWGFEYNSYYGLELIYNLKKAKETWGDEFVLSLLDRLYQQGQSRLLSAYALYIKGLVLAENPNRQKEALQVFKQVVDNYPEEEYTCFMTVVNYAQ
jgi:hypothetical protein